VLVWILASGLSQSSQGQEAAVFMTRIMFPYIGFMSLVALSAGVLNTWRRFAVPAAAPVLLNLSMIGMAWWGRSWVQAWGWPPIYALALGVMLGGLLQLGVMWLAMRRLGTRPWPGMGLHAWREAWRSEGCQRILALMAPALLGVGVAQLSLLINTQIASHMSVGSVSWLSYADRLMEFPTAMLGVALGVVLMPQLAAAKAQGDAKRYSAMLDWGLRLVVALAWPCAVGLLCSATPLVASLYHYGAFAERDVMQTSWALMGYGVGLLGLVSIKVLAPGFYASQDIKTPVKVALGVLILTQLFNLVLVPWLGHAGLALSIGLGACVNAWWLWWGLRMRGHLHPTAGWMRFLCQVLLASAALAAWLCVCNRCIDWLALREQPLMRLGWLAVMLLGSALVYFGVLRVVGLKWRALVRI
jgi:putative peptidoglycan lipid II flippase